MKKIKLKTVVKAILMTAIVWASFYGITTYVANLNGDGQQILIGILFSIIIFTDAYFLLS